MIRRSLRPRKPTRYSEDPEYLNHSDNEIQRTRLRTRCLNEPVEIVSDSESVIYIRPESFPTVDLTVPHVPKTPTKDNKIQKLAVTPNKSICRSNKSPTTPSLLLERLALSPKKYGPKNFKVRSICKDSDNDSDYETNDSNKDGDSTDFAAGSPFKQPYVTKTPRKQKANDETICYVSPPKQRRIASYDSENLHSNNSVNTPSNLGECLKYNTPVTIEKSSRKQLYKDIEGLLSEVAELSPKAPSDILEKPEYNTLKAEERSSQKQLFKDVEGLASKVEKSSPKTASTILEKPKCRTPKTEERLGRMQISKDDELYVSARKALHSSCPIEMPGRETEIAELKNFILKHLSEGTSGSLYVSGPPGTGKTASLSLILQDPKISSEIKEVYINCTAIKSSSFVFSRLVKDLGVKSKGTKEKDHIAALESYLQRNHKTILLVLDEIDQLESKNQSVLYTIFEWPSRPRTKLILIGIANALDLTDRTLPRLQARCELKPKLMHFAPYTKQQIVEIFTSRLKSCGVLDVFAPTALQMLAGKVASLSGDVRRALDIGRRVVEIIDRNKKDSVLKPLENLAEEPVDNKERDKPKRVDLKQVVDVLNNVYGTTQNFAEDMDDTFPLQQKIVICSLVLMLREAKNKDVTVGRLYEVYRKVCSKRNIQVVDQGEFVGLCSLIETKGIIRILRKKDPRMNKVNLEWNEEEVANTLKDKQLMSTIIQDYACLGKM